MLSSTLLFAAMLCLTQPGLSKLTRRKKAIEEVEMFASDDDYDEGSASYYDYPVPSMSVYFRITYQKEFIEDLLMPGSDAFLDEAHAVEIEIQKQVALGLGVVEEDISVEVLEFVAGSTKAEIVVKIPEYFRFTEEEVSREVRDLSGVASINGAPVIDVEEIQPDFTEGLQKVTIIVELVYEYDTSDGSVDLSDETSEDFQNEAMALKQQLSLHLVDKLNNDGGREVGPDQITIDVLSFESESTDTKAQISVQADDVDIERLSYALNFLVLDEDVSINGRPIVTLEELDRDMIYDTDEKVMDNHNDFINGFEKPFPPDAEIHPDFTEGLQNVTIIVELIYEYDTSDGSVDLSDKTSEDFQNEAMALKQQLSLHLVDKLNDEGGREVGPDQITIDVLSFESESTNTKAQISVQADDVDIERLSYALNFLALDEDVSINGRPIVTVEELDRDIIYDTDETEDDLLSMEVMTDKKSEGDDILNGDPAESVPLDDNVVVPDIERVPEYEYDDYYDPAPSDENPPPDDEYDEPVPPDDTVDCTPLEEPNRGTMECNTDTWEAGTLCQFFCEDHTRMEGTDTTLCGTNGRWTYDAPYCIRILCQPSVFFFPNGNYTCNDGHLYQSTCTFHCYEEFELIGEEMLMCQRDETWTSDPPTCQPIPVVCDEHYGEWSECANDTRSKAEITVTKGGVDTVCPEIVEDCIDCKLEWSPWSACDDDDMRYHSQVVRQEKVGAGKECPEPRVEEQQCSPCLIEKSNWTACDGTQRSRSDYVAIAPIGDYECPPLETEVQDCNHCEVEWGEWGSCANGSVARWEEVVRLPTNGGDPCPPVRRQTEDCTDCVIDWLPWSGCRNDSTATRSQVIVTEPSGRGEKCPPLENEETACVDCEVGWSNWSECQFGERIRTEMIEVFPVGPGRLCEELRAEKEVCVYCEMEWGDWEECIEGERRRIQFISVEKDGAGRDCAEPQVEIKDCANCELAWGNWSECTNGKRTRGQYIIQQPFEVDTPCPDIQEEEEPCRNCQFNWSDWSDCVFGQQTRFLFIEIEAVGAGLPCPIDDIEIKECCYLEFTAWSECEDGISTRSEEILVQPEGEVCREPKIDIKDCADCVLDWGEWSQCENNRSVRFEQIVQPPFGGGAECPVPESQEEYCSDCVLDWEPWSLCIEGVRTRLQYVHEEPVGNGKACPVELSEEIEDCYDCEWRWSPWTVCDGGKRTRFQEIIQPQVGAGVPCPAETMDEEACQDCVVEWGNWTPCEDGETMREEYIAVEPVGVGADCPELQTEFDVCVDCEVAWKEWSNCSDGFRSRMQYIVTDPEGAGRPCPILGIESEACVDCVVEWGRWSTCYDGRKMRDQRITVQPVGAGEPCPPSLEHEEEECQGPDMNDTSIICRFVKKVLGYGGRARMRDLLLIGDESGSIGWYNYEKIKDNFKAIVDMVNGGIGTQETQLAMTSFALYSRVIFDFDDHHDADGLKQAIDETFYKGGYRSRIGEALTDANQWVFQQSGGMRSFPHIEDNIEHEILIATDGCRTSDVYHLKKGLKTIKDRGIKLYVLAVDTDDARCLATVKSMIENEDDLFLIGGWDDLDRFTIKILERECFPGSPGAEEEEDVPEEEEAGEDDENPEPITGRGDSTGK